MVSCTFTLRGWEYFFCTVYAVLFQPWCIRAPCCVHPLIHPNCICMFSWRCLFSMCFQSRTYIILWSLGAIGCWEDSSPSSPEHRNSPWAVYRATAVALSLCSRPWVWGFDGWRMLMVNLAEGAMMWRKYPPHLSFGKRLTRLS